MKKIGKKSHECLMVGNDVHEDMIASEVGIKTYLITNHMINRHDKKIKADYRGDYKDFYTFVQSLPSRSTP